VVDVPALANGSYVVDWRVVSADSHPVHAAFTFQVGPESNLESGLVDAVIKRNATGRAAGIGLAVSRSLVTVSLAKVFGGSLLVALGIVPFARRQRVAIGAAGAVGGIAGLLALPFEVGYTAGRGLGVVTDRSAWSAVLDTDIGVAWLVRALVIGVIAALAVTARSHRDTAWWRAVVWLGLITAGVASAYGGHGATGRWHYLGVAATVLHVAAMAVWLGGLALLLISIRTVARDGVRRYSTIALLAVVALVVSGSLQGVRQVGSLDALLETSYGTMLIRKLVLVAAVIGVAAVARQATHGRLSLSTGSVGAAADPSFDRHRLLRAVSLEAVLAVAVVVVTSLLMAANPSQAAKALPFSSTLTENGYLAQISVSPARVGANEVHLFISNATSSLVQPDAVSVTIEDLSRDVNPISIDVTRAGAGHYINNAASFPYAATWRLTLTARYGFEEVTFAADVKVV
jgi:copper transport protein